MHTIGDALCSPHSPARLLLRAQPRAVQVQVLKEPKKFETHLPFGPENQQQGDDEEGDALKIFNTPTDELFQQAVRRIETELSLICGTDPEAQAKFQSRSEGPKFVWQSLCGEVALEATRTTALSRCWRRTANWLAKLAKAKTEEQANAEGQHRTSHGLGPAHAKDMVRMNIYRIL